jgi:hypothetical protein
LKLDRTEKHAFRSGYWNFWRSFLLAFYLVKGEISCQISQISLSWQL